MGFSRQEYWSELPCPPPGDLPDPEIEPTTLASGLLHWQADSLPPAPPGKLSVKRKTSALFCCAFVSQSCLQEAISTFKDNSPFLIFPQTYRRLHSFYSLTFLHFREVCLVRCYPCSSFLTNLYTGSGFNDVPANPIPLANNFCGF